ncbi:Coiled-coil-helix-coiled-coil-helix domain-containing protein 5 [Apophysomyces ossiformis]|uniref:Coiled-coil-helix-coiled-coil-helix domain-containing protein 5 n=1 Tax=Apophysomyces ossiformis TaxID=679940 RepID=A0A8H7ER70_9FUNG|nr:Coiled-coil-helix-coiled-coil-helix domain-containing protein 5 [Apophysomyces ossiformis]
MEDTLDQVREKCALQLEIYQKCVENYPQSWDKSCLQQKRALTKCSEENVGILKFVKQHCSTQIKTYDACLAANPEDPEKCVQALKELYLCTEATSVVFKEAQKEKK